MHSNIESIMMSLRDDAQAVNLSRFFKTGKGQYGEGDKFLGIKVPQTREVAKTHWKNCSLEELKELITCEWHEIRLCALLILVMMYKHAKKTPEIQQKYVDFYLAHTKHINNWDLVDLSCYEILGDWLIEKDKHILYELAQSKKSIWEQRIGIVSTMQLIRHGQYNDTLAIADILLHHQHDLLQKATGWMLREVGKHDIELLKTHLNTCATGDSTPRYKSMPRTMLRYAIEKFPEEERMAYLKGEK